MGFILLLAVIGLIAWAMSWRPRDARTPAKAASPRIEDHKPTQATSERSAQQTPEQWTALDEHQLNRLLNETT
jgi:hypothetical protein